MQVDSKKHVDSGELDVHALVSTLWRQKIIVLCLAFLGAAIAATYAALSVPLYEVKAFIIPPTKNDIENLNYGRAKLPILKVNDVYSVFVENLQAESLRREFFNSTYLPAQGQDSDPKGLFYEKLSKNLLINGSVGKDAMGRYSIVILDADPKRAANWVKQYAERAQELALQEINENISSESSVKAFNLQQRIASLREVGDKVREDTLVNLREALVVAKAIGLERPPIVNGDSNSSLSIAGDMDGELTYMRGTKALEAEIENLKSRKSNDPFIKKLRNLENEYNFYKQLSEKFQTAKTYRMDGGVEASGSPVKPKFMLVVLIGLVLGLMLGVVTALIRNSFSKDESQIFKRVSSYSS
ncbi:LPS O-antigen chain length determinant protein WzzB [Pseudomonas fluorescens]|uniref:LPS O-antigen chain length determinant protein WzzB n=1 Tax=Pseudomonas fluorescens TaxID=294 RepID=UPI000CA26246|nr:Wzz/FepE/Etk N-terminal domain-containing protein [Pseudomonas fluorescens]AUM68962.1 chain-length determining protein [Pseudomonas fluorescens]